MTMKVDIIDDKLVFFPSNGVEKLGIECFLKNLAIGTSDSPIINDNFDISYEEILQRDV